MDSIETKDHSQAALTHEISMTSPGKKIGVIGGGYVGGTIANFYRQNGAAVKVYDKYKKSDPVEEVLAQNYIFIAVPTNYVEGKGMDFSMMDDAMQNASRSSARAVIIKSTILPGTTARYQKQYPNIKILFNPEFLTEVTALTDFQYPDRQLIGYTDQSYNIAGEVEGLLPLAPFTRILPAEAAEMLKFFGNTWFAVKVIFANQMFDICEKLGIDYNLVRDCAAADRRIGRSHLDVLHGGYRGYGGKCLPKDTRILIKFVEGLGLDPKLLKTVEALNRELTGGVDR